MGVRSGRWLILSWLAFCVGCANSDPERTTTTDALSGSWLEGAQRQLAEREYRASQNGEGLQAPNRAHNLRTYFDSTGIRVHDRTARGSLRLVELRLAGLGRGDATEPVGPGEVSHRESRVEIRRPGLVEWFENSPAGLEQGFTLEDRPAGVGPLRLDLAVTGARARNRGDEVVLVTSAGRRLSYGKLVVVDASGKTIPAHFEVPRPERIRLVVDDAAAAYPLVVDPVLEGTSDTLLESDQGGAVAGFSVSTAGDVNADGYDDVLVGSQGYDDGQTDEGAAFLFLGSATGIGDAGPAGADAVLTGQQAGGLFGFSVAVAGDVDGDGYDDALVGMRFFANGEANEGGAFVFLGSASGLVGTDPASAATQLESNQANAEFGAVSAGAGDVNGDGYADVIVGARLYDNGHADEGAAWIFHGSSTGIADGHPGTAASQFEANQANAVLGISVASAGDVNADGYGDVIVGAEAYDVTFTDAGVASIFLGSASGIASGSPSTAHGNFLGNQLNARMGHSVASAGDINGDGYGDVMASAQLYDDGQTDEGIVDILFGSAAGIPGDYTPSSVHEGIASNQVSAQMGHTLGTLGDVNGDGYSDIAVGAHLYDSGQNSEGCAWVFYGSSTGITPGPRETPSTADFTVCSDQTGAEFGISVTGAGDVDGDGYPDLLVGAYLFDAGQADEGAAFVYQGSASGIVNGNPTDAAAQLESNYEQAYFGNRVAHAGDVNADGYSDVIVGSPSYASEGHAFVFEGGTSGIGDGAPFSAAAYFRSFQPESSLGVSVAGAGDVNGDGYEDVIVGAPGYDAGQEYEGAAFIFHGSAAGLLGTDPSTAPTQLESNQTHSDFGSTVAGAGDVNGDGFGDVIVGARSYDAGQTNEGVAFVFLGSARGVADGSPANAAAQLESNQAEAYFGDTVSGAGDVNGDGYADVIVSAFWYDAGQTNEGAAWVFHGSSAGIASGNPSTAAAQIESNQAQASQYQLSVASAGDVNGDGYADVIVGLYEYDDGEISEGLALIFLGGPLGIGNGNPSNADGGIHGDSTFAGLGSTVAGAGDVNGDGYADVITRANNQAYVFLGSASGIATGSTLGSAARLGGDPSYLSHASSAGDVNGDGHADVIAGAPSYNAGQTSEGAAFVFNGRADGLPGKLPRQRRGNGTGVPVAPWGHALSQTGFAAEFVANHPDVAGRVKGEFEACPSGVPFGHASCASALTPTWVDLDGSTPETLLTHTFSGLTTNTLYRWRARVLYAPATGPIPPVPDAAPWRRIQAQSNEGDIRLPEPGFGLAFAVGCALSAALSRRHRGYR